MGRILLVEDSEEIYQLVAQSTDQIAALSWVKTIAEAKAEIAKHVFDLVIFDVDLADQDGIAFCSNIQSTHFHTSIFFLTGHTDISEKTMGFLAGADGYITKPFVPLELRTRLQARLKGNRQQQIHSDSFIWKELQVNKGRQEVLILESDGLHKIELTSLEFKILLYLAARPGVVVTREQILNYVWGEGVHVHLRSVDTHVNKLKRKLGAASHLMQSIHGMGYKFTPSPL